MPRPERMVRRRGVMVVEDGAPVCVHLIPPPFAEAFEGVLQDLLALRLRAAAEGRIEWPALNAACRDLARIWYLQQPAGPVVDQGDVRDAEVLFRDRADGSVPR